MFDVIDFGSYLLASMHYVELLFNNTLKYSNHHKDHLAMDKKINIYRYSMLESSAMNTE